MSGQINPFAGEKVKVNANSFQAKYANKQEVYKFLTHDWGAYLPPYETVTVWHMRDLCSGKRKRILGTEVKHIMVPQYEGLSIKHMLEFGYNFDSVREALPEVEGEVLKLPRQYIANVINTRVGEGFSRWVERQVNTRHEKVADDRNMCIDMDPEVFRVYQASKAVSGK